MEGMRKACPRARARARAREREREKEREREREREREMHGVSVARAVNEDIFLGGEFTWL